MRVYYWILDIELLVIGSVLMNLNRGEKRK